jgi:hypothetical protein
VAEAVPLPLLKNPMNWPLSAYKIHNIPLAPLVFVLLTCNDQSIRSCSNPLHIRQEEPPPSKPIAGSVMHRTQNSGTTAVGTRCGGVQLDNPSQAASRSTIAVIDAETRHVLPEESWSGHAALDEHDIPLVDIYRTGAFTVWVPGWQGLPAESRPYSTDKLELSVQNAEEEERRMAAAMKFDQLLRHGLVVGDRDDVRPLLAMPKVSHKEQERRKRVAQKLVDDYVYESSED